MTNEELEKKVEEYLENKYCCNVCACNEVEECRDNLRIRCTSFNNKKELILNFAELREKRIAELEKENEELKEKLGDIQMQKAGEKSDLVWKLKTANEQKTEQLTNAKEIIDKLLKSLFLAKGIIRDLIDDTVDFKESKERAIYCYEQEHFDTYKEAVQFLKESEE